MYKLKEIYSTNRHDKWLLNGFNNYKKIIILKDWRKRYEFKKLTPSKCIFAEKYAVINFKQENKNYIFTFEFTRACDLIFWLVHKIKMAEQFKREYEDEELFLNRFKVSIANDALKDA